MNLKSFNVFISSNNKEAITASDVLIFAVQPTHLEALLKKLLPIIRQSYSDFYSCWFSIEKWKRLLIQILLLSEPCLILLLPLENR